jgi:hypothetical protein
MSPSSSVHVILWHTLYLSFSAALTWKFQTGQFAARELLRETVQCPGGEGDSSGDPFDKSSCLIGKSYKYSHGKSSILMVKVYKSL